MIRESENSARKWVSNMIQESDSVFDLTPPEKLQLVEDLWDDLASNSDDVVIHDWQKEELD